MMERAMLRIIAALVFAAPLLPAPSPAPDEIKVAVEKALPLLRKGAEGHIAQKTCFACHNQALPVLACATAKPRGFAVPDEELKEQREFIAAVLERTRDNFRKGQ